MKLPPKLSTQWVDLAPFGLSGQKLGVMRADLAHPEYGGNKLFKLTYHLEKAVQLKAEAVLTFGGPWSNHLYATAAACEQLGLKAIAVVRGPEPEPTSTTLAFAREKGMALDVVSRSEYALKDAEGYKDYARERYGQVYIVPEGGGGYLGVMGAADLGRYIPKEATHVCLGMGTGTTAAGILMGTKKRPVLGYPAVKGGDGLTGAVRQALYWASGSEEVADDLMLRLSSSPRTEGRFGSWDAELLAFMRHFYAETGIPIDHVYAAPGLQRLFLDLKKGLVSDAPVWIHTGGLQGLTGLERACGQVVYPGLNPTTLP